jgi:long-chain acyl-CoA synthetase
VAVAFWELDHPSTMTAVVSDTGDHLTYGELRERSDQFAAHLNSGDKKTLGFLLCSNSSECLIAYLGALRSGQAICLLETGMNDSLLERMLEAYHPDWLFSSEERDIGGFQACEIPNGWLHRPTKNRSESPIAPELALLLTTSGSTGSPKLVRLSLTNLQANADSITRYLEITPEHRALTSLPMSYSYGLSVINSHLLAGGTLLLTRLSLLQRNYWDFIEQQHPTSLAGVPYHYELMLRSRLLENGLSALRILTQAGGRLDPERISQVKRISSRRGWRFFVMYGQTEARARIAYVPWQQLQRKIGSIGIAIPGGTLSIDEKTRELIYSGRNVMLGYAENREDLGKGDELRGQLRTGDLARRDEDGYHYIEGRLKRILKVYGNRVSLDEIEMLIGRHGGGAVACFGKDNDVRIAIEAMESESVAARVMKDVLRMHPSSFRIVRLDSIPRLSNSKFDYQSLGRLEGL